MSYRDEQRVIDWERRTAWPLTLISVLFIVVYAVPILFPTVPHLVNKICEITDYAIWAMFGIDFTVRLSMHPNRRRFLRTNLFDLLVLVLPMIRALRALRLVNAILVFSRRTEHWARGQLALYFGSTSVMLVLVAGLAVLDAERHHPDTSIASYPDALWWAIVTITTVGYGDQFPVTTTGRLIAVALMIGGIGLIGFVTGSLASWIVERVSTPDRDQEATKSDVAQIVAELAALRSEITELRASTVGADPAQPNGRETPKASNEQPM